MSKQYNKAEKRKRRLAYLKRKRLATRSKTGTAAAGGATGANSTPETGT